MSELAWDADLGEGGQSDGVLGRHHVLLCNLPPELHVGLNSEEFLEPDAPRLPWCGLEHETAKLGVEDGQSLAIFATELASDNEA